MRLLHYLTQRPIMFFASVPPPINTDPAPTPIAAPAREGYTKCDYCECKLTRNGQVYEMSQKAYDLRDQKDKHSREITQKDTEIAALRTEKEAIQAELNALKASSAPKARGILKV